MGFPPPRLLSRQGMAKVGGLVEGCVLKCFVQEGMTHEQVRRILGNHCFLFGDCGSTVDVYDRYHITVFWSNGFVAMREHKQERVEEVRYNWEQWLKWGDE